MIIYLELLVEMSIVNYNIVIYYYLTLPSSSVCFFNDCQKQTFYKAY